MEPSKNAKNTHSFQNRLILNKYRMDFIFKTTVVKIAQWKDCEEGPSSQVIQTRTKCTKVGETVTLVLPRLSTWPPESRETKKMRERGAQSCRPTWSTAFGCVVLCIQLLLPGCGSDMCKENPVWTDLGVVCHRSLSSYSCKLISVTETRRQRKRPHPYAFSTAGQHLRGTL